MEKVIGIDVNCLTRGRVTGIERYVFRLIEWLAKQPKKEGVTYRLYSAHDLSNTIQLPDYIQLKKLTWLPKKGWTHGALAIELMNHPPHVFFSPAHEIPLKVAKQTQVVSTIHDIAFIEHPDVYTFLGRLRQKWAIRRALRCAKKIITVSFSTQADLMKHYSISHERVQVIPLAVDASRFCLPEETVTSAMRQYDVKKGQYFFTVGRVEKKKNIQRLVEAFIAYKRRTSNNVKLIIAGSPGYGYDEIVSIASAAKCKDDICFLGYVPDADVEALMCGAKAYVFPSVYEGFGIPSLEAMAAGIPLIASSIPAIREVAGNAAIYFDPERIEGILHAFEVLDEHKAKAAELVEHGRKRLQQYDWDRTASATFDLLTQLTYGDIG
ncbi:MAG: glycosyltransferase family 1 protein [bacterium]|nr:glycosyltransferase family 1 protein [bacterium]MDA1024523.1 glycosyltransferase family 1 protein [bacterium]